MNAESAQMVPASGWTGGLLLGVDGFWRPLVATLARRLENLAFVAPAAALPKALEIFRVLQSINEDLRPLLGRDCNGPAWHAYRGGRVRSYCSPVGAIHDFQERAKISDLGSA
jgi:hypothetical protein